MAYSKAQILETLNKYIDEGSAILATRHFVEGVIGAARVDSDMFFPWQQRVLTLFTSILPPSHFYHAEDIRDVSGYFHDAQDIQAHLEAVKDGIETGLIDIECGTESVSPISSLNIIFHRFRRVARAIKNRHDNRPTLSIEDEYDVQDLLYGLLQLFFDDIRREEWVPSYAGGASRVDFLLKHERIMIEVKKTRSSMSERDLGEQLIVDIEKYKSHPDCDSLVCFVYDPDGYIGNPHGIMSDLNTTHSGFATVVIEPL